MPNDKIVKLPKFPIEYGNANIIKRMDPPEIGEHTVQLLEELGINKEKIDQLTDNLIIKTEHLS